MRLLVIDLEATCWRGPPPAGQEQEIIQVGYALLEGGEVTRWGSHLVRPTRSEISPFCTELTGISAEACAGAGVGLLTALAAVEHACDLDFTRHPWTSWGRFDARMLLEAGADIGPWVNAKTVYALSRHARKRGMAAALRSLGLSLEGRHHDAGDDARNIGRVLAALGDQGERWTRYLLENPAHVPARQRKEHHGRED